jgi:hypothetical protein
LIITGETHFRVLISRTARDGSWLLQSTVIENKCIPFVPSRPQASDLSLTSHKGWLDDQTTASQGQTGASESGNHRSKWQKILTIGTRDGEPDAARPV